MESILPEIKIGPSILDANLADLTNVSRNLLQNGADYLHLDVMDGIFVHNLTFGAGMVKCLRKDLGKDTFFDVHMMVKSPMKWISAMEDAGCTQYTYHFETTNDQPLMIRRIKESGMRAGLAIKPDTPVESILPFVELADMVLVMTVEPGWGGQTFRSDMMSKVRVLREKYQQLDIEVDGGVGPQTIKECCSAGANMIVSGTAITRSFEPGNVIKQMRELGYANQWRPQS